MLTPKHVLIMVSAFVLGGCATVVSGRSDQATVDEAAGGVTYFLPTRLTRLTASRTPVVLADLKKERDAKAVVVQALTVRSATAKTDRETAEALLASLNADTTARQDSRDAQARVVDTARAAERLATTALAAASEALSILNAGVNAAETGGPACSYSAKIEILPAQADPDARFVARFSHSPLRDDVFTLKVNAAGLLSSANIVADDRSGQILVDAAGAYSGAAMPVSSGGATPPACADLPRTYVAIFDPVDDAERNALNVGLEANGFPLRIDIRAGDPNPGDGGLSRLPVRVDTMGPMAGGLYYRTPVPVALILNQIVGGRFQAIDGAVVLLPQAGPMGFVPLRSSAFVKTQDDIQFADGVVTSWTTNRPSEIAEFVRLPVRILREIVSVPASLLMLRVDLSTQSTTLAARQQAEMIQLARTRELIACLERIRGTEQSASVCVPAT